MRREAEQLREMAAAEPVGRATREQLLELARQYDRLAERAQTELEKEK